MNKTKRDIRVLVLLFILLPILISMLLVKGDSGQPYKKQVTSKFFLGWDNDSLVILNENRILDKKNIPVHFLPLFNEKIPVNQANRLVLQTIPGIGSGLAERIVDERILGGKFKNADDLLRVTGIGIKRKEKLSKRFDFE